MFKLFIAIVVILVSFWVALGAGLVGAKSPATVLIIHGGGFVSGSPSDVEQEAEYLRDLGYNVVNVSYPTDGDLQKIWRTVVREARRVNATHAIGFSAGGYLAARLAAKRKVRAALAISPPFPSTWKVTRDYFQENLGMTLPEELLPLRRHEKSSRLRIIHDSCDPWSPYRGALRYERNRRVSLVTVNDTSNSNPHLMSHEYYRPAYKWLLSSYGRKESK